MYLSRLTLDPLHPQGRRDLSSRYEMHRTLVRAFAPDVHSPPARFLWRLESNLSAPSAAVLLVQSETLADWSVLAAFPGYALEILGNKPVDLERLIQTESRFRFRLHANPTVTRQGKRFGLLREAEQVAWLDRQGQKSGFALISCLRTGNERIRIRQNGTGRTITVETVLFEGVLESLNAEALRSAVGHGLGHGKAWGLGLFSLARIV
jgi:CRISPR system Cascade subunit CasE